MSLIIIQEKEAKPLSKLQEQFNKYIKQIDVLNSKKNSFDKLYNELKALLIAQILPLERNMAMADAEVLVEIAKCYKQKGFSTSDNDRIIDYVLSNGNNILQILQNDELQKYCVEFGKIVEQEEEELENEVKNAENIDESEEFKILWDFAAMFYGEEKLKEANIETLSQLEDFMHNAGDPEPYKKESKKASKKKQEKIEAKELADKNLSKSIRTIYAALAKKFHPDMVQDEAEKIRLGETMKEVTEAYKNNDLYKLLSLQINNLDDEDAKNAFLIDAQLKYYNEALRKQIKTLEHEIYAIELKDANGEIVFDHSSLIHRYGKTEKIQNTQIRYKKKQINDKIIYLKSQLISFKTNPKNIKKFLKDFEYYMSW